MPYIKAKQRIDLEPALNNLIKELLAGEERELDGEVNYVVTRMLKALYPPKYFNYNRAMGVLSCIQHEFYRRSIAPYEETKIIENGDL